MPNLDGLACVRAGGSPGGGGRVGGWVCKVRIPSATPFSAAAHHPLTRPAARSATRLILHDQAARGLRVPVVALTASVSAEERAASVDAGCAAHVGKPVTSAVVDLLDDLVESSRLGAL